MTGFIVLLVVEQNSSFSKVNNLNNQKQIISTLTKLQKEDIELALIQFNGKSTQLLHDIDKLRGLYEYDYTGQYILKNSTEYLNDLNRLSQLTLSFNQTANDYYENSGEKEKLDKIFVELNKHIDLIIFKNIAYNEAKFTLLQSITIATFIIMLFLTIWYRNRLNKIHGDLLYLYAIDTVKKEHTIFSQEVDAIFLRMRRKNSSSGNTEMIDPVTQVNNYKGMINSYGEKKGMKDSNFTTVTIFEIDNFSKSNRAFTQEVTQAILKKVAFTISLHEQATDVVARTDYNQFTVILSRSSKEQLYKDIDIVRQTVSELKFKIPDKGVVSISVCGGFSIKDNNMHLEEAIKDSKEILNHAKSLGINKISQASDLIEQIA